MSPNCKVKAANVTVSINSLVHVIQGSFVFPLQNKMITVPRCFCVAPFQQLCVYDNPPKT